MTTPEKDAQDLAFEEAKEKPVSDHELLELFDKGEFIYEPYVKIKTPDEYRKERWGGSVKKWLSSFLG